MIDHDYLKYKPLKNDSRILIIGAYDGDFMREYKNEIIEKNIFVVNIEPDYRLFQKCVTYSIENLPLNSVCLNVAITNKNGMVMFDNRYYDQLSGLVNVDIPHPQITTGQSYVTAFTLQRIYETFSPDYIFCDVEGSELEIFMTPFIPSCEYIAIAAYHIRNSEQTYKKLEPFFMKNSNKNVIVDIDETRKDNNILYLIER